MTLRICSGFNPANRNVYGLRFASSFRKHWPPSVECRIYVEQDTPELGDYGADLWACSGVRDFIEKYRGDPAAIGRRPHGLPASAPRRPRWRSHEWAADYSFRFDAVKFCRQLFIPEHASLDMDDGSILAWLDGDVETLAPVPARLVENLVGVADGAYLGRVGKHSEIGFWAVRLNRNTREFLRGLADTYRTGEVFRLNEWHSAFVWDHVRTRSQRLRFTNLTPLGTGNVFDVSALKNYMRHDKGKRKYETGVK